MALACRVFRGTVVAGAAAAGVWTACALGGCNILGAGIVLLQGPPKTDRVYELNPKSKTVVFIDDRNNRLPFTTLKRVIGERAEEHILKKKLVEEGNMIASAGLVAAVSADKFGEPQSVVALGRSVGAHTVIYGAVDDFRLTNDGQTLAPTCKVRVRIVDTEKDEVVWPPEKEGYPLTVSLKWRSGSMPRSSSEMMPIYRELADPTGLGLAQMFYTFENRTGAVGRKRR